MYPSREVNQFVIAFPPDVVVCLWLALMLAGHLLRGSWSELLDPQAASLMHDSFIVFPSDIIVLLVYSVPPRCYLRTALGAGHMALFAMAVHEMLEYR